MSFFFQVQYYHRRISGNYDVIHDTVEELIKSANKAELIASIYHCAERPKDESSSWVIKVDTIGGMKLLQRKLIDLSIAYPEVSVVPICPSTYKRWC